MTNRRVFLWGAAACTATAAAGGWLLWPAQGWSNPCGGALPASLARHEIVQRAWEGITPERVWDCHAHLIGTGDSGSGIWLNPQMHSVLSPVEFARRMVFLNAGCAHGVPDRVDESYVARMRDLMDAMAPGAKAMLLAFDYAYAEAGERREEHSAFHTPNAYAARIAAVHARQFEWAASIHPYRSDCVEVLEWAAAQGARAVKWLPPAMGIDPASARCDRFYAAAARLDIPLLTHAGEERAVHGAGRPDYGNPLRLRRALDHGVRVVVAHCASMGADVDLDRGPGAARIPSFELFVRLMDEPRYVGRLFGDLSAVTQVNRAGPYLHRILQRQDWHRRLLNGSDYPLPGIMPLFSVDRLAEQGFLDPRSIPVLKNIREYNPLLFDFVLKRELRSQDHRFPPQVFHTRDFFLQVGRASHHDAGTGRNGPL